MGNLSEAVGLLGRYLDEGDDVPSRELLQQRLNTMRTRLAAQATEPDPTYEPEPEPERDLEPEPEPTSEPEPEPAVAGSRSSSTLIIDTRAGGVAGGAIAMLVVGGVFTASTGAFGLAALMEDGELESCSPSCGADELDGLALLMVLTDVSLGIAATAFLVGTIWAIVAGGGSDEPTENEARVAPWIDATSGGVAGIFTF